MATDNPYQALVEEANAELNIFDSEGYSALWYGVMSGNIEITKLLLDTGAAGSYLNKEGLSEIAWAQQQGDDDMVALFIDAGAQLPETSKEELKIEEQPNRQVESVLEESKSNPLFEAIKESNAAQLKELLENGADIELRDGSGNTALICAAAGFTSACLELLLQAGATVNVQNKFGTTALINAVREHYGDIEKVSALLKAGADANVVDSKGHSLIYWAIFGANEDVSLALIQAGVDVNIVNEGGVSTLMQAIEKGYIPEIVEMLLNAGADTEYQNSHGTALMLAAESGKLDIVNMMITAGANINTQYQFGKTALSRAAGNGHDQIVEVLKEAGAI